jgi:hypothetical protein
MSKIHRSLFLYVVMIPIVIASCALPAIVSAADAAISQGFSTNENSLPAGTLVSQQPAAENFIESANSDRAKELVGVVANQPLVELSSGAEIQVVVSGITQTLVSNINGPIKAGDRITPSPIKGVGMKAVSSAQVVGIAQADLNESGAQTLTVTDQAGQSHSIKTGLVPVQVGIAYYAGSQSSAPTASYVPPAMQSLANNFAGKNVSPIRVMAAGLILILGFISISTLLYSSVRSGISSLGRNPLAGGAIRRGLAEVAVLDVGILILTIIATYVILSV